MPMPNTTKQRRMIDDANLSMGKAAALLSILGTMVPKNGMQKMIQDAQQALVEASDHLTRIRKALGEI